MDSLGLTSSLGTALVLTPVLFLYLVPAMIAAQLALYGWQQRQFDAAVPFSMLMAAVAFWAICHTLSAASSTFAFTLFWAQLQYGGIVLVAPAWLLFALAYHGTHSRVMLGQRSRLLLPAAFSYAAVLTNDWHHLWWPTVALDSSRQFGSLSITRGVLFWLHSVYSYSCIGLGYVLIMHRTIRAPLVQRRQARLLALGALFPIAGNLAHIFGVRTTAIDDPTPVLFVASGLVIFYAALRYQFPDVAPISSHALLANIPDGLVVLDQRGIVRALNDAVPRLMNLPAQARDWIGQAFQRVMVTSPLEVDLRALLSSPDTPATQRIAYEDERGLHAVEFRLRPLHAEAIGAGVLLMMRDWSERARLDQRTEQRLRELTAVNRTARLPGAEPTATPASRFLARLTHELRTPLTALIGWTDLLDRGLYGELPERAHEPLAHMRRNGQTLLHLINDILDFSKIEAGQFTLDRSPVDLAAVIYDMVGAMQPLVQERELTLKLDIPAGLPLVYAHRERLEQVLINLIANAIKFTDAGSIVVQATADGERVRFSVTDSGIGIAPEQQQVIFEEFQQLDNQNHDRYPGTGLGLAISKRLMTLMDGTLTVESTPGVGSTFYGELPIAPGQMREREHGAR